MHFAPDFSKGAFARFIFSHCDVIAQFLMEHELILDCLTRLHTPLLRWRERQQPLSCAHNGACYVIF